jgi:hypothetical protein
MAGSAGANEKPAEFPAILTSFDPKVSLTRPSSPLADGIPTTRTDGFCPKQAEFSRIRPEQAGVDFPSGRSGIPATM